MRTKSVIWISYSVNTSRLSDDQAILVSQIVLQIEQQRDMLRVDDLSASWNIHTRKLQRLFNQYVGISPKMVIKS